MTQNLPDDRLPAPEETVGAVHGYGPYPFLGLRCTLGGILMGLANLVPGISGGTMLVASGVYPYFIQAIADITTLKWNRRSLFVLAIVAGSALVSILALAGVVQAMVIEHRWAMYSLFIGLTLGGVPVVWGMARPAKPATWAGFAVGLGVMVLVAEYQKVQTAGGTEEPGFALLFVGGVLGAGAMVLPGISGSYLLMVLGIYEAILGGIRDFKDALTAGSIGAALGPLTEVVIPVGLGVVVGIAAISNLFKAALARYEKGTLGLLLGFLVGAVHGLWPFQRGVPFRAGDIYRGRALSAADAAGIAPEKWGTETFDPSTLQVVYAGGLVILGFLLTALVAKFGKKGESGLEAAAQPRMSLPSQPRGDDSTL